MAENKSINSASSQLSGCYLLIVIGEPSSIEHRDIILQKITKGFLSWDLEATGCCISAELQYLVDQSPIPEDAKNGERLIQFVSEQLVTEVLINPQATTLQQCIKNLLSSYTKHKHIIHSGYTFAGSGSWILQDSTFSFADFLDTFQDTEVQRIFKAYENSITVHVHCAPEGEWSNQTNNIDKEPWSKLVRVTINPNDKCTNLHGVTNFVEFIGRYVIAQPLEDILEPSDVVGNIRFSRPTLYVFPGGQGDSALFGVNGFNMLIDGGFNRRACFWDFARHLDRVDAMLVTRVSNSNLNGVSSFLKRKVMATTAASNHVYPKIGHVFCNIVDRHHSPDGDKDTDSLLISLAEEGDLMMENLRHIGLKPQNCYRQDDAGSSGDTAIPLNLYHKVGHGKLDMYVLNPAKDSKEVKEFLRQWNSQSSALGSSRLGIKVTGDKEISFPVPNLMSICAILVWQPADPTDSITRILFPGSSPQSKIFDSLDRIRQSGIFQSPVCSEKSLQSQKVTTVTTTTTTATNIKTKPSIRPFPNKISPTKISSDEQQQQAIKQTSLTSIKQEKKHEPIKIVPRTENKKSSEIEISKISTKVEQKVPPKMETKKPEVRKQLDKKPEPRKVQVIGGKVIEMPKLTNGASKLTTTASPKPMAPPKAKTLKEATNKKAVEEKTIAMKKEATKKEVVKKVSRHTSVGVATTSAVKITKPSTSKTEPDIDNKPKKEDPRIIEVKKPSVEDIKTDMDLNLHHVTDIQEPVLQPTTSDVMVTLQEQTQMEDKSDTVKPEVEIHTDNKSINVMNEALKMHDNDKADEKFDTIEKFQHEMDNPVTNMEAEVVEKTTHLDETLNEEATKDESNDVLILKNSRRLSISIGINGGILEQSDGDYASKEDEDLTSFEKYSKSPTLDIDDDKCEMADEKPASDDEEPEIDHQEHEDVYNPLIVDHRPTDVVLQTEHREQEVDEQKIAFKTVETEVEPELDFESEKHDIGNEKLDTGSEKHEIGDKPEIPIFEKCVLKCQNTDKDQESIKDNQENIVFDEITQKVDQISRDITQETVQIEEKPLEINKETPTHDYNTSPYVTGEIQHLIKEKIPKQIDDEGCRAEAEAEAGAGTAASKVHDEYMPPSSPILMDKDVVKADNILSPIPEDCPNLNKIVSANHPHTQPSQPEFLRTPDEVADLPIHEEVTSEFDGYYHIRGALHGIPETLAENDNPICEALIKPEMKFTTQQQYNFQREDPIDEIQIADDIHVSTLKADHAEVVTISNGTSASSSPPTPKSPKEIKMDIKTDEIIESEDVIKPEVFQKVQTEPNWMSMGMADTEEINIKKQTNDEHDENIQLKFEDKIDAFGISNRYDDEKHGLEEGFGERPTLQEDFTDTDKVHGIVVMETQPIEDHPPSYSMTMEKTLDEIKKPQMEKDDIRLEEITVTVTKEIGPSEIGQTVSVTKEVDPNEIEEWVTVTKEVGPNEIEQTVTVTQEVGSNQVKITVTDTKEVDSNEIEKPVGHDQWKYKSKLEQDTQMIPSSVLTSELDNVEEYPIDSTSVIHETDAHNVHFTKDSIVTEKHDLENKVEFSENFHIDSKDLQSLQHAEATFDDINKDKNGKIIYSTSTDIEKETIVENISKDLNDTKAFDLKKEEKTDIVREDFPKLDDTNKLKGINNNVTSQDNYSHEAPKSIAINITSKDIDLNNISKDIVDINSTSRDTDFKQFTAAIDSNEKTNKIYTEGIHDVDTENNGNYSSGDYKTDEYKASMVIDEIMRTQIVDPMTQSFYDESTSGTHHDHQWNQSSDSEHDEKSADFNQHQKQHDLKAIDDFASTQASLKHDDAQHEIKETATVVVEKHGDNTITTTKTISEADMTSLSTSNNSLIPEKSFTLSTVFTTSVTDTTKQISKDNDLKETVNDPDTKGILETSSTSLVTSTTKLDNYNEISKAIDPKEASQRTDLKEVSKELDLEKTSTEIDIKDASRHKDSTETSRHIDSKELDSEDIPFEKDSKSIAFEDESKDNILKRTNDTDFMGTPEDHDLKESSKGHDSKELHDANKFLETNTITSSDKSLPSTGKSIYQPGDKEYEGYYEVHSEIMSSSPHVDLDILPDIERSQSSASDRSQTHEGANIDHYHQQPILVTSRLSQKEMIHPDEKDWEEPSVAVKAEPVSLSRHPFYDDDYRINDNSHLRTSTTTTTTTTSYVNPEAMDVDDMDNNISLSHKEELDAQGNYNDVIGFEPSTTIKETFFTENTIPGSQYEVTTEVSHYPPSYYHYQMEQYDDPRIQGGKMLPDVTQSPMHSGSYVSADEDTEDDYIPGGRVSGQSDADSESPYHRPVQQQHQQQANIMHDRMMTTGSYNQPVSHSLPEGVGADSTSDDSDTDNGHRMAHHRNYSTRSSEKYYDIGEMQQQHQHKHRGGGGHAMDHERGSYRDFGGGQDGGGQGRKWESGSPVDQLQSPDEVYEQEQFAHMDQGRHFEVETAGSVWESTARDYPRPCYPSEQEPIQSYGYPPYHRTDDSSSNDESDAATDSSSALSPKGFEVDSPEVRHLPLQFQRGTRHHTGDKHHRELGVAADLSSLNSPSTPYDGKSPMDEHKEPLTSSKNPFHDWGEPMGLPSPIPPPISGSNRLLKNNTTLASKINGKTDSQQQHPPASPKRFVGSKGSTVKTRRSESPASKSKSLNGGVSGIGTGNNRQASTPIYVDLTYVPHHGNPMYSDVEFFRTVRARYYVFSGTNPGKEVFDALLAAKRSWGEPDLEVTIIPTYDTDTLGYWFALHEDELAKHKIDLAPSASRCTINLQDHETSCSAYRLEF